MAAISDRFHETLHVDPDFAAFLDRPEVKNNHRRIIHEIREGYYANRISACAPKPEHKRQFLARSDTPLLSAAAPWLFDQEKRDTYGYRFLNEMLKHYHKDANYKWHAQYQKRGTCVGQDFKLCADDLMAKDSVRGLRKFLGRAAVAGMYPGGRVDVAGEPGSWDGSYNSVTAEWAIAANGKGGVLLLHHLNLPDDSRDSDEQLAVKWTASREGVPSEYEDKAKAIVVTKAIPMSSFDDCAACIMAGGVVAWAHDKIPSGKKDRHGFSVQLKKAGGHSVAGRSVRFNPDGCSYDNSWDDDWAQGPNFPDDQPPGSVWMPREWVDDFCRNGDTWGLFGIAGLQPMDPAISTAYLM